MSLTHLTDFPDRFSPMLVKELRQGLRAKTFIGVFLSLQAFLAIMMLSATAASSSSQIGIVVSNIIFGFFSVAVLLVQPLRGIGALSSEIKSNTLDMMALTRLSASKIVFGKWVAIVSQTTLLLATIIPYLILRYFFGGMNLLAELVALTLLFLTSVSLTAVTVGLSGSSSVIIRSLLPIFGLPVLSYLAIAGIVLMNESQDQGDLSKLASLADSQSRIIVATYVAAIAYIGLSMLSLGSSLIAAAAENHSIRRRIVALAAMLIAIPLCYFDIIEEDWHILVVFVIAIPAIVIALTESLPLVATVCKPFVKRGRAGKTVGWLFYPTWPSGILFAILMGLLGYTALFIHPGASGIEFYTWSFGLMGSLYFPAAWQVCFFRGESQRITNYLLVLVGSYIMIGVLAMLADAMNSADFLWLFAWNPLAYLVMSEHGHSHRDIYLGGVIVTNLILFLILAIRALSRIRKSASIIEEAETVLTTNG